MLLVAYPSDSDEESFESLSDSVEQVHRTSHEKSELDKISTCGGLLAWSIFSNIYSESFEWFKGKERQHLFDRLIKKNEARFLV